MSKIIDILRSEGWEYVVDNRLSKYQFITCPKHFQVYYDTPPEAEAISDSDIFHIPTTSELSYAYKDKLVLLKEKAEELNQGYDIMVMINSDKYTGAPKFEVGSLPGTYELFLKVLKRKK